MLQKRAQNSSERERMGNPLGEGNGLGEESFAYLVSHSPQKHETEKGVVGG